LHVLDTADNPALRDVHFATATPALPLHSRILITAGSRLADVAIAAALLALVAVIPVLQIGSLRSPAFWGIVAAVVILGGASSLFFFRLFRLGRVDARPWPVMSDKVVRVRVAGPPRLLERLSRVRDESFEPMVFAVYQTRVPEWSRRGVARAIFVLVIVVMMMALTAFLIQPHPTFSFWQVLAAMAVARLADSWMWPAYLRLAPGQIEVIKYPWLGRGSPAIEAVDLRTSRVLITRHVVFVRTPSEDLLIGGINTPERAEAVLRAAVSTAPTPPLPQDSLA
jgi:hypothetical protein